MRVYLTMYSHKSSHLDVINLNENDSMHTTFYRKLNYMNKIRVFGPVCLTLAVLITGCATVNKSTEKEAADTNNQYRSGNVQGALQSLDASFNKESYLAAKEKTKNDTIYYLEKGTFLSNLGQTKLNESTQNFLVAKNTIKDWEDQTALSLNMSVKQMMASVSDSMNFSQFYVPRDYEKSLVGFELMTNHALAKRVDLAYPEAKSTTELDEFLSKARRAELDVANEKAKDQRKTTGVTGGIDRVDQIPGYPIDTFNTKDVLELKNSYFNAGTYYLAGFVREAMGSAVTGEADTDYQNAIKINPNPFFKQALTNLSKKVKPGAKQSDTLIIVDTGFLSDIYSFKATIPFATKSGPKAVTWVVPAVRNNAITFNPQKIDISGKSLPLTNVANVEAMSRRELKDQMPSYIARAVTSSIIQIVAQEVAQQAIDKNKNKNETVNALMKIGVAVAVNALAAGDVDTRMWKSLPSGIYMARAILPQGESMINISTPAGQKQVKVVLNSPYEVIKLRVFNSGVVAANYPKQLTPEEYGAFTQSSAVK